jgi:hypothetical protein
VLTQTILSNFPGQNFIYYCLKKKKRRKKEKEERKREERGKGREEKQIEGFFCIFEMIVFLVLASIYVHYNTFISLHMLNHAYIPGMKLTSYHMVFLTYCGEFSHL